MNAPIVIVLASGRGERFAASGGQGSKLYALLGGRPVLAHTLAAARASGLPVHVEDAGHPGMGDSIAAGVAATRHAGGWLILPGDLPLIAPQSIAAVAQRLQTHAVVVPNYRGERGHPVGFGTACKDALLALSGPRGAQAVAEQQAAMGRALSLALEDEGILIDIDTLADLQHAAALLASAAHQPLEDRDGGSRWSDMKEEPAP